MNELQKRFSELISEYGNPNRMANALGLSKATPSKWLGKSDPNMNIILTMFPNLNPKWFVRGIGPKKIDPALDYTDDPYASEVAGTSNRELLQTHYAAAGEGCDTLFSDDDNADELITEENHRSHENTSCQRSHDDVALPRKSSSISYTDFSELLSQLHEKDIQIQEKDRQIAILQNQLTILINKLSSPTQP